MSSVGGGGVGEYGYFLELHIKPSPLSALSSLCNKAEYWQSLFCHVYGQKHCWGPWVTPSIKLEASI